ncbi:hypothetical protein BGZ98_007210, partial [Dissophora globulifera]
MSLPKFLRGFQKKSSATTASLHSNLSDLHLSDSSSSSSSGPKDAFGFPIPVTTTTVTITPIASTVAMSSTASSVTSSPRSSLYPGPLDIVNSAAPTASAATSAASSLRSIKPSYNNNNNDNNESDHHQNSSSHLPVGTRTKNRTSRSSSRSSVRLSMTKEDASSGLDPTMLSTSCPQLTLPSFTISAPTTPSVPPLPSNPVPVVPVFVPMFINNSSSSGPPTIRAPIIKAPLDFETTLPTRVTHQLRSSEESTTSTAMSHKYDTQPVLGGPSRKLNKDHTQHHQQQLNNNNHHTDALSRSRSNTMATTSRTTTSTSSPVASDTVLKRSRSSSAAARTYSDYKSDSEAAMPRALPPRRHSRSLERTAKTGSISSIASSTSTFAEISTHISQTAGKETHSDMQTGNTINPDQFAQPRPLHRAPSTRSRSLSSPHSATASSAAAAVANAAANNQPVPILKSKPKSILRSRSRSGSHPTLPNLPPMDPTDLHNVLIPAFPAPPTTMQSPRSSDVSAADSFRSSLYLMQDPMVGSTEREIATESTTGDSNITTTTAVSRRTSSVPPQRRPSLREYHCVHAGL